MARTSVFSELTKSRRPLHLSDFFAPNFHFRARRLKFWMACWSDRPRIIDFALAIIWPHVHAQAGIFALGTSSHAYLEFDILGESKRKDFASAICTIREPRTTTGGVNFVIGFRPELWRNLIPDDAPEGLTGFNQQIRGTEGFVMPATQHDALVWLSGSAYDVLFDMARSVVRDLSGQASLVDETSSWPYRHDRDLTGFIDGSENPTLLDAPMAALLPEGVPGAAGSVLLLQKWKHK